MMLMKRTRKPVAGKLKPQTWLPTNEDLKLIGELRAHIEPKEGIISNSALVRRGLRKLAESEGLTSK